MEFNVQPYNDDFEQNAKDNNYLKILFKPGFSVQARELTQIQSILQNQIKAFGDHIFQDGSPVIGGNIALDNGVTYLMLDETYNNADIELDLFVDKIILRDSDSLVQAKVLASYYPSGGVPTLLVKYLSGVDFSLADVFKVAGTTTRAKIVGQLPATPPTGVTTAIGKGTIASINDGIFYVDGYFVTVTPQTAVVSAYTQTANVKIGLEVNDDVVDYGVDATLLDPAQDSFNYQAPGADRYQFSLNLSTRPLDTAVDESKFFELMRLESGSITKQVKYPIYSEIEKTLARRTFDESGDYTVVPFRASVSASHDDAKYIINIEPGKAYVKGFEFETIGTFRMEVDKPRTVGIDTRSMVDIDFDVSYGNYLKFKNVWGSNLSSFLDSDALEVVDLHCVHAANVAAGVGAIQANNFTYANTKIGTAKIRNLTRDIPATDGLNTYGDSNGVFNIYLTDVTIKPRVFRLETNASTSYLTLPPWASAATNAYNNCSVTVLPILLTPLSNIDKANVNVNSRLIGANGTGGATFTGNVSVGDIIRVGDETKQVVNVTAQWLTCNSVFSVTANGTATNPLPVFKQTTYSSNVTNQSRIVTLYDGSTKQATLDRPFDDSAIAIQNTIVQFNFGIKDIESIVEANSAALIVGGSVKAANAHANIAIQSLLLNGDAEFFEASDRKIIFRLPQSSVKRGSLVNVDYTHTKYISGIAGAAGVFNFSTLTADESIPWSITNSNIQDNLVVVIRQSANASYANGSVVKLATSGQATVSSYLSNSIKVTLPSDVSVIDAYVIVKEADAGNRKRGKIFHSNPNLTLSPYTYPANTAVTPEYTVNVPNIGNVAQVNVANGLVYIIKPTVTNIFPGDSISLYVPDVVKVRKILAGNTTALPDATNVTDVTDNFVVDYGQTDELYEHAKLTLKQGYPSPNAMMTVHLDFFDHSYPSGASYFSVDSYEDAIYQAGTIPIYYSDSSGTYYLRDCLDFRPTRRIGVSSGVLDTGTLPSPDAAAELSFDYYLPRIDKLVLSKNKEFRIITGTSSTVPVPPDDNEDAMTLYTIYLPPFVATVDEVRLKYNENKRYTMKDISRIDKRVEALEYYTALNNIENKAMADSSKYEDGTDKLKYGVIGEGFNNFNITDYKDPDFNVSMQEGEMGPKIGNVPFNMQLVSTTNVSQNRRTMTLGYTETPMVSQAVTSNKLVSVQPFLFAQFVGDCVLSPEMDFWVSEELRPDVLRAPQVVDLVAEVVTNAERLADAFIEHATNTTIHTPTINAAEVIIPVPATDPATPAPANTVPVIIPSPPPIVWAIPVQPSPPTPIAPIDIIRLVVPVTVPPPTTTYSGGGGGCVVLESYIPWVEPQQTNDHNVMQAYQLEADHQIWLADEITLDTFLGTVKKAITELQPCVRVTTADGTSLVCSTTAPLPTLRGVHLAPEVLGEKVAVFKSGLSYWETVTSVESVGDKFVRAIDAHNKSFWAGEKEGAYILHHNMAIQRTSKVNKV